MKKVPSYPKITAKTNITVTQTQNININSPKGITAKRGFKKDQKKSKNNPQLTKNEHSKLIAQDEFRKTFQYNKKSCKKVSAKEQRPTQKQKALKNSKSQRELEVLSEKLKKLELKIKTLKAQQKEKKSKIGSASNRSFSKNKQSREHSDFIKKDHESTKKIQKLFKINQRSDSSKILKKSYSDKLSLKPSQKHGININKKSRTNNLENSKQEQKQEHEAQIIHKFVTQVPKKNNYTRNSPIDLKISIQKSLRKKTYDFSVEDNSQSFQEARMQTIENYSHEQCYYLEKCIRSLMNPSLEQYREHVSQSLQTLQFLEKVRKPSLKEIQKRSLTLAPIKNKGMNTQRFTVVLDLDETLIHCNETLHDPHDVKLNIVFPKGQKIDAGVNIRPYAHEFLKQLVKICEVIVFTASHECYANVVLDYLDPQKNLVSYRLFRDHCWQTQEGIYIKDLRVLKNRSLDNIILVDNAAYSYYYQLQNGVPIIPFYDNHLDTELVTLLNYIKQLIDKASSSNSTLRKLNHDYFQLKQYSQFEDWQTLTQNLYKNYKEKLNHEEMHHFSANQIRQIQFTEQQKPHRI